MRSVLLILLSLAIMIGCATKKPPEPTKTTDIIEKEITPAPIYLWAFKPRVYVRENNAPSSSKIALLSDGDSVVVVANKHGWYQIKTEENTTGWVRTDLLGPKNLSAFRRAVSFVDSLQQCLRQALLSCVVLILFFLKSKAKNFTKCYQRLKMTLSRASP